MNRRMAPYVFVAAILCGWIALRLAQNNPPSKETSTLHSMSAAELQGVKRVAYDVDPQFQWSYAGQTLVLAGWSGDLRLTTIPEDEKSVPLELVREGDTVFVRAKKPTPQAPAPITTDVGKKPTAPRIAAPVSIALPASITELDWPKTWLMMASSANMASLTIRSHQVHVGDDNRRATFSNRSGDSQVIADLQSDAVPGKLELLTIQHLQSGLCPGKRPAVNAYSDGFSYDGGFFSRIALQTQAIKMIVRTMEPDMQMTLFTPPHSMLTVSHVAYLKQIQVRDLSQAQEQALELEQRHPMLPTRDCDTAKGP